MPMTSISLDQDSVRLLAVEGCAALGKLLEPQDCVAHILPVIISFSQVCEKLFKFFIVEFFRKLGPFIGASLLC